MAKELNKSQVNHLRRLLGWARCEVGQTPEEMVEMWRELAPRIGPVGDEGKARLVEAHQQAARVPQYIRAAIKALEPLVKEAEGQVVQDNTTRYGLRNLPANRRGADRPRQPRAIGRPALALPSPQTTPPQEEEAE